MVFPIGTFDSWCLTVIGWRNNTRDHVEYAWHIIKMCIGRGTKLLAVFRKMQCKLNYFLPPLCKQILNIQELDRIVKFSECDAKSYSYKD